MVYIRPQSYYDSMDLEPEQIMNYLAMGRKMKQKKIRIGLSETDMTKPMVDLM